MIRRRSLRTRAIKMLVLDEADEMLNKGMSNKSFLELGCISCKIHEGKYVRAPKWQQLLLIQWLGCVMTAGTVVQ